MLELSALGLLQRQPLHGYRLKKQLEVFMGSCISVNYGAIYPLLKRLEERGEIEAGGEEASQAGPSRKMYQITEQGRNAWRKLMQTHPQESWVNSRSRFYIKFFFFNDLEPEERINLLEHRLIECRLREQYLQEQEEEFPPVGVYQIEAMNRCYKEMKIEIEWVKEQLAKERSFVPASDVAKNLLQTVAR
ncbi:PadR family transcriptional regulator [Ancylothrix sp. C2]|uniref:PadR family transcriptional regulator n=1 Tax=Ancylothrix sp. D3o TaxID=2953691 RepID=UPI0021BB5E4F|nr:PadR family transcriptional regulator [Ancylothrix sp. D3o]MCT7950479.1 PadR family transcriptional regulator [Ancylothrix sp. D3o]